MDKRPSHISTFSGGMDKDTNFANIPKEKYYDLKNGRVIVNNYSNSFSISPFKQPEYRFELTHPEITECFIIGSILIREGEEFKLILFTTGDPVSNSQDAIWLITNLDANPLQNQTPVTELLWYGTLGFKYENIVEGISKYETPNNIKIYWWDDLNKLRYCNIKELTFSFTPDMFDTIPTVALEQPLFSSMIQGDMKSGKIQYAYRVYNNNGGVSNISPFSGMIHLTGPNISEESSTHNYLGTPYDVNTKKGVKMVFNNLPPTTNKIVIYSIHYTTYNSQPIAKIVIDDFYSNGKYTLIDTGTLSTSTTTTIEDVIFENYIPVPKTGVTKHNSLYLGNIHKKTFNDTSLDNIDFRAYRFIGDNNVLQLTGNPSISSNITTLNINTSELKYVDKEADAIQNKASQQSLKYQFTSGNSPILGGSGLFIDYEFFVKNQVISMNAPSPVNNISSLNSFQTSDNFPDNKYQEGYDSVAVDYNGVGYCRDEVYPFAIVFTDNKGFKSFPRWIADIKMPNTSDFTGATNFSLTNYAESNPYTNKLVAQILGVKFTLKNINLILSANSDIVSWEIVRMHRSSNDKSIVCQGTAYSMQANDLSNQASLNMGAHPSGVLDRWNSPNSIFTGFVTPDYFFNNRSISFEGGDKLRNIGRLELYTFNPGWGAINDVELGNRLVPIYNNSVAINKAVSCSWNDNTSLQSGYFLNRRTNNYAGTGDNYRGSIIGLITVEPPKVTPGTGLQLYNWERDISTTAYGGNTYNDRFNRKYISIMNTVSIVGTTDQSCMVLGGDTYISIFDYLASMFGYNTEGDYTKRKQYNIQFPVESTFNLGLRHGYFNYKRNPGTAYTPDPAWSVYANNANITPFMESAGVYGAGDTTNQGDPFLLYTFTQPTDYYLYNTVYSQYPLYPTYIPKPQKFDTSVEFDARIIYSDTKITGESKDSWLTYRPLNFKDLDYEFGPINKLIKFKDNVFSFQSKAFSAISINPRVALTVDSGLPIQMGSGSKLERFDYLSTKFGCRHRFGAVATENGLYFFDALNKKLILYTGQPLELSDVKGMYSYFNKDIPNYILNKADVKNNMVSLHYDKINNDVIIYFNSENFTETINDLPYTYPSFSEIVTYNELMQAFNCRAELGSNWKYGLFLETDKQNFIGLGNLVGEYDRVLNNEIDTEISVVVNPNYIDRKVFDNLYFDIDIYDMSSNKLINYVHTINDYHQAAIGINNIIKSIQFYNDYQNTRATVPILKTGFETPIGYNLSRVEREYQFSIPPNDTLNPALDILDDTNTYGGSFTTPKPLFRDRMKGKYVVCKMKLNVATISEPYIKDTKPGRLEISLTFALNYLKTLFRQSY